VSKNIERIADLATNIAEEVIFINTAKTIKHHADVHTRS
jgi:phosphate uptake regulator